MLHVFTLPSGLTLVHPIDVLATPEITIDTALALADEEPLQKSMPHFVIDARRAIEAKIAVIQAIIDNGGMDWSDGMHCIIALLGEADNYIQKENAKALSLYAPIFVQEKDDTAADNKVIPLFSSP